MKEPRSNSRASALRRGAPLLALTAFAACAAEGRAPESAMAPASPAAMGAPAQEAPRDLGEVPLPMAFPGAHPPAPRPPPPQATPAAPPPPAAADAKAAKEDARDMPREPERPPPVVWAPVRQFPAPSYAEGYDGPRDDFRETVFWAPSVITNERGTARVELSLSDAVTSFRAIAEGVAPEGAGRGEAVIASKLPVSIATKLPVEMSVGDELDLPVTLTNALSRKAVATITPQIGPNFERIGEWQRMIELPPKGSTTIYLGLRARRADPKGGLASIGVEAAHLGDAITRNIKVVPAGFPKDEAFAGTLGTGVKHAVPVPEVVPDSLVAEVAFYPSPTGALLKGTEAMIAEPSGCFEQASSANYPNVMVLGYLSAQKAANPSLVAATEQKLDKGYKLLVGYEAKNHGYDWFGEDPGHEALTAYGLLEFLDMAKVYKDLDQGMIQRTRDWLLKKRDGRGGYTRNSRALDSFGGASDDVTNAYITYALTEAGEKDLEKEVDLVKRLGERSRDPYVVALAANALANVDPRAPAAKAALTKLAGLQAKDGHYPGAKESITRSGGVALEIETTALATLAHMKTAENPLAIRTGLDWLAKQRNGLGGFGSTQSTVLALKALTRAATSGAAIPEGSIVRVRVNGGAPHEMRLDPAAADALKLEGLAPELRKGANDVEIAPANGDLKLQYSMSVRYRSPKPVSASKTAVKLAITAPDHARVGESIKVKAIVTNTTQSAVPMTMARIGIPGGTTYQTWQLKELKEKKIIDFYETREREVILYFRGLGPGAKKAVDVDLLASVPGKFTAPPSQAYLYYTDELRQYVEPLKMTITR